MAEHEPNDGFTGPAVLIVAGREPAVHPQLDARHEPHDGPLHWFGRIRTEGGPPEITGGPVELCTQGGRTQARIGDVDPWGRYRVSGVGMPPIRFDEPDLED